MIELDPFTKAERINEPWKPAHAAETDARTLEDAHWGGCSWLSSGGVMTKEMIKKMAARPIIFAMANPVPEIWPDEAKEVRPDAIIATGRSDFPNQVNNVLGFPYIFRGALDVRASKITENMKIAAANALAMLAREDVPDAWLMPMAVKCVYGKNHIIPTLSTHDCCCYHRPLLKPLYRRCCP